MDTNETTIYTAVLITGIVIGAIILYFAISMFRNHRRHFKLLSQQFQEEMELLEKERTRIARDLHDELGPLLSVVQIHINAIGELNSNDREHLEKASQKIEALTERFSGIARNLTPKILITKGLKTALEDFIEDYSEVTAIQMRLHYRAKSNYNTFFTLHIYRILQELIQNGVKHSGATILEIQIVEFKGKLYLYYTDDGKGIDEQKLTKQDTGLGLASLKNRAEMLSGKMKRKSNSMKGTEYFFEIPIKPNYEAAFKNSNSR
jgi:signal transduction histidine kinase